jgi:hypothetical protein
MKLVDMSLVTLVHSGESWAHEQPPCSRQMIHMLERNEEVVTWVQVLARPRARQPKRAQSRPLTPLRQPKAGTVEDQFPVIRIRDEYYTMSLRMMKAVW